MDPAYRDATAAIQQRIDEQLTVLAEKRARLDPVVLASLPLDAARAIAQNEELVAEASAPEFDPAARLSRVEALVAACDRAAGFEQAVRDAQKKIPRKYPEISPLTGFLSPGISSADFRAELGVTAQSLDPQASVKDLPLEQFDISVHYSEAPIRVHLRATLDDKVKPWRWLARARVAAGLGSILVRKRFTLFGGLFRRKTTGEDAFVRSFEAFGAPAVLEQLLRVDVRSALVDLGAQLSIDDSVALLAWYTSDSSGSLDDACRALAALRHASVGCVLAFGDR
jgi:hypothetical protein